MNDDIPAPVLGKRYIRFDNIGTHTRRCLIRLFGVLRELQCRTTVTNGEIRFIKWTIGAFLERLLKLALTHILDKVERSRTQVYIILVFFAIQNHDPF